MKNNLNLKFVLKTHNKSINYQVAFEIKVIKLKKKYLAVIIFFMWSKRDEKFKNFGQF